jgi:hypothetical protein
MQSTGILPETTIGLKAWRVAPFFTIWYVNSASNSYSFTLGLIALKHLQTLIATASLIELFPLLIYGTKFPCNLGYSIITDAMGASLYTSESSDPALLRFLK